MGGLARRAERDPRELTRRPADPRQGLRRAPAPVIGDETVTVRVVPKVPPGAWKLRIANGAPFGLVDVPR